MISDYHSSHCSTFSTFLAFRARPYEAACRSTPTWQISQASQRFSFMWRFPIMAKVGCCWTSIYELPENLQRFSRQTTKISQHSHWKHCAASTPDMRYHLHTLPSRYPTIKRFLLAPPFFKPILGCKRHVGNNLALQIQASKNQCKERLLQKKQKHWASEILGSNTLCGPCWKPKAWQETTSEKWYIETKTLIYSDKHGLLQGSYVNFADWKSEESTRSG